MSSLLVATQQPGVTFRTDVNSVEIHAVVIHGRGKLGTRLGQGRFRGVRRDGMKQSPKLHEARPDGSSATRQ